MIDIVDAKIAVIGVISAQSGRTGIGLNFLALTLTAFPLAA